MTWKKLLIHGVVAGLLAALAGIIYQTIYWRAFETDYSAILNTVSIITSSIIGTLLIALGYGLLYKLNAEKWIGVFNIVVAVLSFASIVGPLSMELPLSVESPELFPGLAIPMHFFPALSFLTIAPFFKKAE